MIRADSPRRDAVNLRRFFAARHLRPTGNHRQIVVVVMIVAHRHQLGGQLRHANPHAVVIRVGHDHRPIFGSHPKARVSKPIPVSWLQPPFSGYAAINSIRLLLTSFGQQRPGKEKTAVVVNRRQAAARARKAGQSAAHMRVILPEQAKRFHGKAQAVFRQRPDPRSASAAPQRPQGARLPRTSPRR